MIRSLCEGDSRTPKIKSLEIKDRVKAQQIPDKVLNLPNNQLPNEWPVVRVNRERQPQLASF